MRISTSYELKRKSSFISVGIFLLLWGCSSTEEPSTADVGPTDVGSTDMGSTVAACDAEPEVLMTADAVPFVRTPDSCFDNLPDWPYAPQYVEIDGLRQAYVDQGDPNGPVVLLLHGQPSWSYLYRKMIPVLAQAGFRVIAMDHLGMGRSDKPTDITAYSYLGHYNRLLRFIEILDLRDINLFVQDWGSLIGLRVAGLNADRFARIAVGDGDLPVIPAGAQPYPPVQNPDEVDDSLVFAFASAPAQQMPAYDENCALLNAETTFNFGDWMEYSMKAARFRPSEVLEALTWFPLSDDEEAAYDAPFPSRIYMGGPRTFPSLVNELGGQNAEARANLLAFDRPFITIWAGNDAGTLGQCSTQDSLICDVAGAAGQAHARLPEAGHFLQDDQGPEIARRLVAFIQGDTSVTGNYTTDCTALPVAADGTGTQCTEDMQCSGLTADKCITGRVGGFCSVEGCVAGGCQDIYLCCHDCNPQLAGLLPFDGSACFPPQITEQLSAMAGCTCD